MLPQFEGFPKMSRLSRQCVITEKIDGTNAQVFISDDLSLVLAGSRTRWIDTKSDNFGFARWVEDNRGELLKLGPGRHFGEWWGSGIQRSYGLKNGERRFSLFNVARWGDVRPACCLVVPVLYRGVFDTAEVDSVLGVLRAHGSVAAPGFMNPEGVVVYHEAAQVGFKKTCNNDGRPKSALGGAVE
jgi:hypothetical protein